MAHNKVQREVTPAWSFGYGKRNVNLKNVEEPGPGAYNDKFSSFQGGQAYKLGKSGRNISNPRSQSPGPGQYNAKLAALGGPRYTIGQKNSGNLYNQEVKPGPGQYKVENKVDFKTPAWSFNKKKNNNSQSFNENIPGPGQYNIKSKTFQNQLGRFIPRFDKQEKSDKLQGREIPGPGQYSYKDILGSDGPQYKIGQSHRYREDKYKKEIPGPGTYKLKDLGIDKSKAVHILPRRNDYFSDTEIPGPGQYDPKTLNLEKAPGYRIGKAAREQEQPDRKLLPGPGAYNPKNEKFREKSLKFSKSSRDFNDLRSMSPGPGSYSYKDVISEGPKYGIRGKKDEKLLNDNPGPGHYKADPNKIKQRSPGYVIGKESKINLTDGNSQIPGPGQYNFRSGVDGPKWKILNMDYRIGTDHRDRRMDKVGQGADYYKIPHKIGLVPKYILKEIPTRKYLYENK